MSGRSRIALADLTGAPVVLGLAATLKIVLVVIASSVAIGVLVGFQDGAETGRRAFGWALPLCAFMGTLQVAEARFVPWVVLAYGAGLAAFLIYRRRKSRSRGV